MNKELPVIIDESIKLEENVAKLYNIFYKQFPEDSDFWWKLKKEEEKHATLIRDGKEPLLAHDIFPSELLSSSINELVDANDKLESIIREYSELPPSREVAFKVALNVELSTGEIHFNKEMNIQPSSGIMNILQELTEEDRDHAVKIRNYMKEKGIGKADI